MRGRAGDDHPARMEQRTEAFEDFIGRRSCGSVSRFALLDRPDHGQRVRGDREPVADDDGIDVDAVNVGPLDSQTAQPDQAVGQGVRIDGRLATERMGEQPFRVQAVDHRRGFRGRERDDREHDVVQRFGQHAAQPEHDARPEVWVAHQAGDQFAFPRHHLGHEQADLAIVRPAMCPQFVRGAANRVRRVQPQPHEVAFGLVRDACAAQLDRDRQPQRGCGFGRSLWVVDEGLARDRYSAFGQQAFGLVLGQARLFVGRGHANRLPSHRRTFVGATHASPFRLYTLSEEANERRRISVSPHRTCSFVIPAQAGIQTIEALNPDECRALQGTSTETLPPGSRLGQALALSLVSELAMS